MAVEQRQDLDSSPSFWRRHKGFTLLLSVVALLIVASFAYSLVVLQKEHERQARLAQPSERLLQVRKREDSLLHTYGVVDSAKGLYRIPIDSAMVYYLRELSTSRR